MLRATAARLVLLVVCLALAVPASAQDERLTLRDIHASSLLAPDGFEGGRWAEEGPVVTYIEREGEATHLMSYDLETGERTRLVDGEVLRAPDVERLIAIEDYAYSPDGEHMLLYTDSERVWRLNTKGYYYLFDLESETLTPIAARDDGFQMFAKFSPDGERVAFVRDRDLFVVDLATMTERRLTEDGSEGGIINGTSDWVYEEEFGLRDGWSWSPDGRRIAYVQLDETNTREFFMADLRGQYPAAVAFRYPKAGEVNSEIRVGVVDVATGERRFFDTDTWNEGGDTYEYIPQLGWTPEMAGGAKVYLFRMDRDQNDLDLLYGDPETMEIATVLQETSDTWLDVETGFSDLDVGNLTYLGDGEHFVWISERDGYRHLFLYENDGTFVRQITDGDWDVTDFHGVDETNDLLYFTAARPTPYERHLYRVPFRTDGGTAAAAEPERITERAGWHGVNLSRDLAYYLDAWSDASTPTVYSLHTADGERLQTLEDNAELRARLERLNLAAPEFTTVPGADGTPLNAMIIRPSDFDAAREYPLLMYVYGGPGSQTVRDAWGGSRYLWHQYLADELGMIVATVDNRGTGARGNAFKTATYKRLGVLEAQDQIAAAQHFGDLPYVDEDRMGIWGWSYGGYMTLMSLLTGDGPETFALGMSVAPVTDWRQYDTIYTERYMSTPQRNEEGYGVSAPTAYADRLQPGQDLLIVHGDFDDNVHFQNAVQMVDALQEANKQFDFMMYPGRNHGIGGGLTRLHLHQMMTDYLREHLVPEAAPVVAEPIGAR